MIEYGSIANDYDKRYSSEMSLRENAAVCEILNRYEVFYWNVLDVGCGTGFALDCVSIPRYTGIDISKEMISVAKNKYPKHAFYQSSIGKMETQESYEIVLSLFSIPYIGVESVKKIYDSLVSGGVCICVYYNKPYLNADSVYFGRKEEFDKDVLPKTKEIIKAFKFWFDTIEEHKLTQDETYTVTVFRK